jgi:MFS family permease
MGSESVQVSARVRPRLRDFWTELPREGKLLLSTIIVDFVGTGLVLPFLVVYLHEVRRFPLDHVGVLVALPAVVTLLILGPTGHVIDRVGARKVIIVALVCSIIADTLLAFATTELLAALALAVMGVAGGIIWPAIQSFVSAVMPSHLRQRYFGMSFTLLNLGIGIGGILGGTFVDVARPETFVTIYLVNAASFLAPLAIYLGPLRHTGAGAHLAATTAAAEPAGGGVGGAQGVRPRSSYLRMLRDPVVAPLFALGVVSAFVGYAQLGAGAVAFARAVGQVSTRAVGYAFTVNTVVIVVLQLLVLQRIEHRRRTRVLLVMCGVWALAWVALGLTGVAPGGAWGAVLFAVCCGVFGFGETLLQPTIPAMTNDLATDANRGRYNALMSMGFQCAAIVAPIVAAGLVDRGWGVVYIGSLVGGCGGMAWLALVVERRIPAHANGVPDPG